ncbi:hypothetical protein O181_015165 [Austropuccinia psidii MF-1]|uniref:Uncharacterized protein n=1 Tax=Austropuccinia psidii MF-1 TaxID=1389203 RepID=A0A9Q3GQN2_9BASI|nr:hypothetical protein [Austropuccinia psidii MF-1]
MAKNHLRTQNGHKSVHGLWKPREATSPSQSKDSPPVQEKTSLSSMHSLLNDQEWCIYGIIYHYAAFLLSKPMVKILGPNYLIPNQVPNPSPILKEDVSAIQSGNYLAATRRPFEDANHLALQEFLGSNQASYMALDQLDQSIFHCGKAVPQFNYQDGQSCIVPIQTIQPGDSPSRIILSAFYIYWAALITWGLFPQLIDILDLFLSFFYFTLLK